MCAMSGYNKYSVILYSYFILNLGTVRLINVMSHERFSDCYKIYNGIYLE